MNKNGIKLFITTNGQIPNYPCNSDKNTFVHIYLIILYKNFQKCLVSDLTVLASVQREIDMYRRAHC